MKSYFLENIEKPNLLEEALDYLLQGQRHPWLIQFEGDPMAYVNIEPSSDGVQNTVVVDVSGRHYNKDQEVLNFLKSLQSKVGGVIENDA